MKKIFGALTTTAIALTAGAAFAGATVAEGSHLTVRAEWARSQAKGGYGFPLTAIPLAVADAFTRIPDGVSSVFVSGTPKTAARNQPAGKPASY